MIMGHSINAQRFIFKSTGDDSTFFHENLIENPINKNSLKKEQKSNKSKSKQIMHSKTMDSANDMNILRDHKHSQDNLRFNILPKRNNDIIEMDRSHMRVLEITLGTQSLPQIKKAYEQKVPSNICITPI